MNLIYLLQILTTDDSISLFAVFFAGLVAFFSPCVLPIVPLYVGYLSGNADYIYSGEDGQDEIELKKSKRRTLINTVAFVLGISFVYLALALAASSMGQFLRDYGKTIQRVGGIIVIVLGVFQLASKLIGHNIGREHRLSLNLDKYRMNPLVAFLLGFTFSFAWTPCIGPILLSVIAMVANAGTI
ncbi:MAG: cytochrome c biogenesis protein CcdA, partial [Eubacteriales bacterium]|nr:cytochrome c biogenesis protein CcdA [Eubacteriales bacterium]